MLWHFKIAHIDNVSLTYFSTVPTLVKRVCSRMNKTVTQAQCIVNTYYNNALLFANWLCLLLGFRFFWLSLSRLFELGFVKTKAKSTALAFDRVKDYGPALGNDNFLGHKQP